MNEPDNAVSLNVIVPCDVKQYLEQWARHHRTSKVAEVVRSVRERAERERVEAKAP